MQFYQRSRRSKPHRHKTVKDLTKETTCSEGIDADRKSSDEIESRISKLEEALGKNKETPPPCLRVRV